MVNQNANEHALLSKDYFGNEVWRFICLSLAKIYKYFEIFTVLRGRWALVSAAGSSSRSSLCRSSLRRSKELCSFITASIHLAVRAR